MRAVIELFKAYLPRRWRIIVSIGGASFIFLYYLDYLNKCRQMKMRMINRKTRSIAEIEKLRETLKLECIETEIANLPFEELRTKLREGQLSSYDVLRAYQAKAIEVNDRTNAITGVIPDAEILATAADQKRPEERGPLHGIPISLKESCGIKGLDCTAGFGALIDNPLPDDSVLLKVIKACGAIPFIRTNIPQGMASYVADNHIYGLTVNPHNCGRGPGGSSGGEGAVIGGKGSILGLGSDLGGSVRIPANYCGCVALKPTPSRLSIAGNFGYGTKLGGQTIVPAAYGPMGRDVNSVVEFMKAVLGPVMFELDPKVPPLPFNAKMYKDTSQLTVGVYTYDGCIRCVPAVKRAVTIAKETIEKLGHKVVEFDPPDAKFALNEIFFPAFFGDEMENYRELVKHDNTFETFYQWVRHCSYPQFIRWFIVKWKQITSNDPLQIETLTRPIIRSVRAWWDKHKALAGYQANFLKEWQAKGLDLVICPCMPSVAFKNGLDNDLFAALCYTALYNVLSYPAGSLPVTKVNAKDVEDVKDSMLYSPGNDLEQKIKEDFPGSEGMPIGIQVVGLPYREEQVLRLMKELETHLKFDTQ